MRCLIIFIILISSNAFANGYICWAKPDTNSQKQCENKRTCRGVGTYAWNKNRNVAKKLAIKKCKNEFGSCIFDYCEKR